MSIFFDEMGENAKSSAKMQRILVIATGFKPVTG
jgi:hypothetical protein